MTGDSEEAHLPNPWTDLFKSIIEGGLPQFIAGPAGKAISRLIAGAANIPAAWFEQKARAIKDETEARSVIMKGIASASSIAAQADPALLDRALQRHVSELYRSQENREAIAKKAIENLVDEPPAPSSDGPSDEWLDVFERDAGRATSERVRDLYARVLAGEIRQPGSFSLSTLKLLNVLDSQIASTFNMCLPYLIGGSWLLADIIKPKVEFGDLLELEGSGVLQMGGGFLTKTLKPVIDQHCMVELGRMALLFKLPPDKHVFNAYSITRAGRELATIVNVTPAINEVATFLLSCGATNLQISRFTVLEGERKRLENLQPYNPL